MANQNAPFGLNPISSINGSDLENLEVKVYAPSSYASALYVGQPVKIAAGGANATAVDGFLGSPFKIGQLPIVEASAAGEPIDYILTSFVYDASTEDSDTFRGTASTERLFTAIPAAGVICEIQSSEAGAFAVANVNACADIVGVAGSGTSGFSSAQLDTTYGTTGQLKIMGVSFDENNSDVSTANVNLRVVVNESNWYGDGTGV